MEEDGRGREGGGGGRGEEEGGRGVLLILHRPTAASAQSFTPHLASPGPAPYSSSFPAHLSFRIAFLPTRSSSSTFFMFFSLSLTNFLHHRLPHTSHTPFLPNVPTLLFTKYSLLCFPHLLPAGCSPSSNTPRGHPIPSFSCFLFSHLSHSLLWYFFIHKK